MNQELVTTEQAYPVAQTDVMTQVDVAKRYPRDVSEAIDKSIALVTRSKETALGAHYSIPRAGKKIVGKSARLAEASYVSWGNMRVQSRVLGHDNEKVTAEAVAWDMESNVAITRTCSRSILDKNGNIFSKDMIITTGAAAESIARRNAILSVIPGDVTDEIGQAATDCAMGGAKTIEERRKGALEYMDQMGVSKKEMLEALGRTSMTQVTNGDIQVLLGWVQAITEGETTVDDVFRMPKEVDKGEINLGDLKPVEPTPPPAPAPSPEPETEPEPVPPPEEDEPDFVDPPPPPQEENDPSKGRRKGWFLGEIQKILATLAAANKLDVDKLDACVSALPSLDGSGELNTEMISRDDAKIVWELLRKMKG